MTPFLVEWTRQDGNATTNLVAFLEFEFDALARGGLVDAFWQAPALAPVVAWVYDPATYLHYAERDDAMSQHVAELLERLEQLNAS